MSSTPATPNTYPYQNQPVWSKSEKVIARRVFDAALKRELQDVTEKAKRKANQIKEPADLWGLERYLTRRRNEIDRKYDFRASRLTEVLGRLLYERRISEEELHGLAEDKMKAVRSYAKILSLSTA